MYYQRHVFVCGNVRQGGAQCCGGTAVDGCDNAVRFLRGAIKAQGEHGRGKIRVNRAGCFDRCQEGPALVVYPDGVWYRYESEADLAEIARKHLLGGETVERLRI